MTLRLSFGKQWKVARAMSCRTALPADGRNRPAVPAKGLTVCAVWTADKLVNGAVKAATARTGGFRLVDSHCDASIVYAARIFTSPLVIF